MAFWRGRRSSDPGRLAPPLPIGTLVIFNPDYPGALEDPLEIPIIRAVFDQGLLILHAEAGRHEALGSWQGEVAVRGLDGRQVYASHVPVDLGVKTSEHVMSHTLVCSLRSPFPGRSLDRESFHADEAARRLAAGYPPDPAP